MQERHQKYIKHVFPLFVGHMFECCCQTGMTISVLAMKDAFVRRRSPLGCMGLAAWAWQHGLAISTSGPQNATNATYSVVTPRNCRGVAAYHVNCAASYGKMSGQWQHKGKEATRLVHTLIVCIMFNSDRRYFKGW